MSGHWIFSFRVFAPQTACGLMGRRGLGPRGRGSCWADAHPTGEAAQIEDAEAHAIDARSGRAREAHQKEAVAVVSGADPKTREKIGQDHLPSRLGRVLQVRLEGKRDKRAGRTDGQPCVTGSHSARLAIASVACAIEAADFSEALNDSGEIGQEHLDRLCALRALRNVIRQQLHGGEGLFAELGQVFLVVVEIALAQDGLEAALDQLFCGPDGQRGIGVDRGLDALDLVGDMGGVKLLRDGLGVGKPRCRRHRHNRAAAILETVAA